MHLHFRGLVVAFVVVITSTACRDLSIGDPPPPPGPGSIQGNVMFAAPGRSTLEPAVGATAKLSNGSFVAFSNADGYFRIEGVTSSEGTLLIRFDVDRDGLPERQKRISLAEIGAGFGKDLSLGQIVLGRNATVQGSALRSDAATQRTGHGGTSVFVPEGPFATQTADDGSFVLENMPEGPLTLAFFRPGYDSTVEVTELRAGERLTLEPVILEKKLTADLPGTLAGRVIDLSGAGLDGVTIGTSSNGSLATTGNDGSFSATVPSGVYTVKFTRSGYVTFELPNVLVPSGATSNVTAQLLTTQMMPTGGGGGSTGGGSGGAGGGATGGGSANGGGGATGGGPTGGGGGTDAGTDAGADAGIDAGPIAVITPLPAYFNWANTNFAFIDGTQSSGVGPLTYHWRQTSPPDGGLLSNFDNDSTTAVSLQIPITVNLVQYGLELRVTDAQGVTSAPANATLRICQPPFAAITGAPATVLAGTTFTLSGANSLDTNVPFLPLIRYEWTSAVGNVTLEPVMALNGRDVVVRAPNFPTAIRVGLRVFNAYEADSPLAVTSDITVLANPAATDGGNWALDAFAISTNPNASGTSISVPELTVVELRADAGTPPPGVVWQYDWTPKSGAGWSLSNDQQATATFVAPTVKGPTQQLNFTVQVTAMGSGANPSSQSRSMSVAVTDETPPAVIASTASSGTGSLFGVILTFDEPVNINSPNDATIYKPGYGGVAYAQQLDAFNVYLRPVVPFVPGAQYDIYLQSVADTAPVPNIATSGAVPIASFTAGLSLSLPFKSVQTSVREPVPGLLHKKDLQGERIQPFGRRWNGTNEVPWFLNAHAAQDFSCPAMMDPCPWPSVSGGAAPVLTADAGPPLRRGYSQNGKPLALLQAAGIAGAPNTVLLSTNAMDQPVTLNLDAGLFGPISTTGDDLWTLGLDGLGNLRTRRFDGQTGVQTVENIEVDGGVLQGEVYALSAVGQRALMVTSRNATIVVASRSATGWEWNQTPTTMRAPRMLWRPGFSPPPDVNWYVPFLEPWDNGGFPEQRLKVFSVASTFPFLLFSPSDVALGDVHSFDAVLDDDYLIIAWSDGAVVRVAHTTVNSLNSYLVLPGAHASPVGTMNANPACAATHPELVRVNDFLYLVWQERCFGQDWNVVFRMLH